MNRSVLVLVKRNLGEKKYKKKVQARTKQTEVHLTPRRRRCISHTYLWARGFQQYLTSFKISQKPFYSQVNDKEWQKKKKKKKKKR